MKKKVLAIVLCVAMLAIAIVGGTLAYFTDVDQATNVYGVAGLDISLVEDVNHVDGVGNEKPMLMGNNEVTGLQQVESGIAYQHIMPGDVMTKVVTVTNDEDYPAFVALAIKQNDYKVFNTYIDDHYEAMTAEQWAALGFTGTTKEEVMQKVTEDIFTGSGWNMPLYDKDTNGDDIRYYPSAVNPVDQDGSESYFGNTATDPILIAVDYTIQQGPSDPTNAVGYKDNMFGEQYQDGKYTLSRSRDVYGTLNVRDRLWVYYLYLPAGESYELDLTITCPTYVTKENVAAFDNMSIDVRAAAIQVDGFATAKNAFTELFKTFDFSF